MTTSDDDTTMGAGFGGTDGTDQSMGSADGGAGFGGDGGADGGAGSGGDGGADGGAGSGGDGGADGGAGGWRRRR